MNRLTLILCLCFIQHNLSAGGNNPSSGRDQKLATMKPITGSITIDGIIDEPGWQKAFTIENFLKHYPTDSGAASSKTIVKIANDDNFIYIAATLYDEGWKRIIQSLKRDNMGHWSSDAFSVILDPIEGKTNGFIFGVNAGGAQMEGALNMQGSYTQIDLNWDNKWFSAVHQFQNYWSVEMAIPLKTLRYNSNQSSWGINFLRNDMQHNEFSTWRFVPRNVSGYDLNNTGNLQWEEKPLRAKGNIALIPFVSGNIDKNQEAGTSTDFGVDAGLDAKIAVTSSLNLDLTINPDFSNVDVDQQITNLDRFSLFFPEKRSFFLENSDLFANFGPWRISPFFSRQIGLRDGEAVPILYGARLSGNVTNGLRIGIMDVQTRSTESFDAENYGVAAFQQSVFKRASIRGLFVNRQNMGGSESESSSSFNRVGGMEFHYLSKDSKLAAVIRYHSSFNPEKFKDHDLYSGEIGYNDRSFFGGITYDRVGKNFITDTGFNPRLNNYDPIGDTIVRIGYTRINPWIGINFFPKEGSFITTHGPRIFTVLNLNNDWTRNEQRSVFFYNFDFRNTGGGFFRLQNTVVDLPYPLDLIGDATPLPAGKYNYTDVMASYSSDTRKVFTYQAYFNFGTFYNGEKITAGGQINVRAQPWGNFGISYATNFVDLPGEYGNATFHIIGPTAEISFSNKMFWTSFLQYNNQANNFNINSRFQWRYRPMSDIFLVYTDNYGTPSLHVKNRAVVLKVTYWLNL